MIRRLLLALTVLLCLDVQGQRRSIDSLVNTYRTVEMDLPSSLSLLNDICYAYRDTNPDSAIYYGFIALEKSKDIDSLEYYRAWSLSRISSAYWMKARYLESLDYAQRSMKIFEELNDLEGLGQSYNNIANTHNMEGEHQKSLDYYAKSIEIYRELGDDYLLSRSYANIGRTYYMIEKFPEALANLEQVKKINQNNKISPLYAVALNTQGDILQALNSPDEALKYYFEALEITETLNIPRLITYSTRGISEVYQKKGDIVSSNRYARRTLELSKQISYLENVKNSARIISDNYLKQGQFKSAYEYYVEHVAAKDSMFSMEREREIKKLEENFEIANQQREIELLTAESEFQKQSNARQRSILYALIVISILVGAVIIVQYRQTKHKQKSFQLLTKQKNQLSDQNIDIKAQREEILKQSELLKEANSFKDKMFSIISHDLRGPLNNLQSMTHMMEQNILSSEKLPEMTRMINNQVSSLLEMINNLLFWSKSQMSGAQTDIQSLKLDELIDANIKLYQPQADKKDIKIVASMNGGMRVFGDKNQIDCVIRNLINNAVKFTQHAGSLEVGYQDQPQATRVYVKDTGVGMEPEKMNQLFVPGKGIQSLGTDNEAGHGIGLFLCKEFVENNGGEIGVNSVPGKGTTFFFTLPNEKSALQKEISDGL